MRHRTKLPWETYHRALQAAKISRGRFLLNLLTQVRNDLKQQICERTKKWRVKICSQCC
jgi:hypothetical protein